MLPQGLKQIRSSSQHTSTPDPFSHDGNETCDVPKAEVRDLARSADPQFPQFVRAGLGNGLADAVSGQVAQGQAGQVAKVVEGVLQDGQVVLAAVSAGREQKKIKRR